MKNLPGPLKEEEQEQLLKAFVDTKDKDIKDKLVLTNQRLVLWVAKRYFKPGKNELEDLFQQGILGLMKAVEDYDFNRGSFGNYAAMCIKGSIVRDMANTGKIIRIPSYMVQEVNHIISVKKGLAHELGRVPTNMEISLELDIDIKKVEEILMLANTPISLNTLVGDEDGELTIENNIIDENSLFEDALIGDLFMEQVIQEFKPKLSEEELNIIILSYCISGQEYTMKAIGEHYNLSVEQVRQKKSKALREMRNSYFMQQLRRDLDERTSFYKSIDYSQPRSSGGSPSSPVERIVLERERRTEKLLKLKGL